jgi:hypothetical protein
MSKKETLVESVNFKLSKLNEDGVKEYKAWFLYYFNMGAELINLLTEDQIQHCYIVLKDMVRRKELRLDETKQED